MSPITITFGQNDTPGPMAWTQFALANPADAQVRPGVQCPASDLEIVNSRVNESIRPDFSEPRLNDPWRIHPASGQCHDYAVTKRHDLLGLGWASSRLLLAECLTAHGKGHMVLIVDDLVLDNLIAVLRHKDRTGYRWTVVQSPTDPNVWTRLP